MESLRMSSVPYDTENDDADGLSLFRFLFVFVVIFDCCSPYTFETFLFIYSLSGFYCLQISTCELTLEIVLEYIYIYI